MPVDNRLIAQIDLIIDNVGEDVVAAYPADWRNRGFVEYLYRRNTLLTRQADAQRVDDAARRYLSGLGEPEGRLGRRDGTIDGLVAIDLGPHPAAARREGAVPFVLDAVDAELGREVAKPDTLLYVAAHPCPANEPEPDGGDRPFPDPNDIAGCGCEECPSGRCRGKDVNVTVADMGLARDFLAGHDWLDGVDGEPEDPFENGVIRPYAFHGLFGAGNVRVTAPEASVFVERDVVPVQAGSGAAFESDVTLELEGALARDPQIIVFVFTASTRNQLSLLGFDLLYETRIEPRKDELVFLAPAGNEGLIDVQYPAAYPWAVAVGALTRDGTARADFSNYGKWVDVFAVGKDLLNAFGIGPYTYSEPPAPGTQKDFTGMALWSGTSFSTPLVAGLIATRMSCQGVSAPEAARALLEFARTQRIEGVGPVLRPGDACRSA